MGIDKDKSQLSAAELRRHAEERLNAQAPEARPPRTEHETKRLLHELQVHQIELEMQNTEIRLARDEVETTLENYTELYDFAPVGYFTLDRNGAIRAANLTGPSLLGVERSRLIGRQFKHFVAAEARPTFTAFLRKVFESRAKDTCEVALPKEGKHPLFAQIEAVASASGQECRIVVIDISDRKRAEEELQKSEKRYRSLFENMLDGFAYCKMLFDDLGRPEDFVYLAVNKAFEALTGLKNVVGKKVTEAIPGIKESHPELFEIYGRVALTGQPETFELEFKPLGLWLFISVYSPARKYFVAVFDDITMRKQVVESLQRTHAELEKRVAERTEELASVINILQKEIADREIAEEKILRLNRLHAVLSETDQAIVRADDRDTLFHDFCRISVEEGGFKLSWIGLVDGKTGQVKMVASHGAIDYLDDIQISANEEPAGFGPTGIAVREGTYYICNDFMGDPCTRPWHARGHAHGIRASASIALKLHGNTIGALTLYADKKDFFDRQHVELLLQMGAEISFALDNLDREALRREAEQALRAETSKRLQAVEELRAKEQLLMQQNRLAAMGEMIGNIAHQWRQPLNTLGLIIQELPMSHEFGTLTRENLDASVAKAKQVIYHMSQTIDDFRNFFRPDKEKTPFKINDALARTIPLIESSFREQRITIASDTPDDIFIHGYPNEYSQVILNILVNARDAFAERPADLPKVVLIRMFRENNRAVLTITDNAGGIDEKIIEKIFDPYFTTKGPDKGTGVGLFMSKTIIEKNMNGILSARNSGDGAEFRIEV